MPEVGAARHKTRDVVTACLVLLLACASLAGCSSIAIGSSVDVALSTQPTGVMTGSAASGFGSALSVYGDVAIVGAPFAGEDRTGAAYVYRFFDGAWTMEQHLGSPQPIQDGFFGSSVAVVDGWVAVGARTEGVVYVYVHAGLGWELVERIQPTDSHTGDGFGTSLVLDGDRLAVSAPWHHDSGPGHGGTVYLYRLSEQGVEPSYVIRGQDLEQGAQFGSSLGLAGATLAVGAGYDAPSAAGSGTVFLFDVSGPEPRLTHTLTAPRGLEAHAFGASLALSDGLLAVGSPGEDYGGYRSGPVFVFERSNTAWRPAAVLRSAAGSPLDRFGFSLSLVGRNVIVGTYTDNDVETGSTYVVVFHDAGSDWIEAERPVVSSLNSTVRHASVAGQGTTLLIGVPADFDGQNRVESYSVTRSAR